MSVLDWVLLGLLALGLGAALLAVWRRHRRGGCGCAGCDCNCEACNRKMQD